MNPAIERERIDEALVGALLAAQFPELSGLPVRLVQGGGNDHRNFHLGEHLSVRLPADDVFVPQP